MSIVIKGKYNEAAVMIDSIDDATMKQIIGFLNHPSFAGVNIVIMPDCHAGEGSCIGFTSTFNNHLIPNIIGVDIGCGVMATNIGPYNLSGDKSREKLDCFIHDYIPSGFSIHDTNRRYLDLGSPFASDLEDISNTVGIEYSRTIGSIGTLGSGNHFIEVNIDKANGDMWLMVHTGSRKFGLTIADYYQKKAAEALSNLPEDSPYYGESISGKLAFLNQDVNTDEYDGYLYGMRVAKKYANINRKAISSDILKWLGNPTIIETIDTVHNYISSLDGIIRKGAVSAAMGERLVIPFNSLYGTAVCTGVGNSRWNFSAPHGAGRLMSRKQAKRELEVSTYQSAMHDAGIYTTTANSSTLDESFQAYKDPSDILKSISETVIVDKVLTPIYNFKNASKSGE